MGQFEHLGEVDGLNVIALPITRSDPATANKDGMQEAHLTGAKLYNEDLQDVRAASRRVRDFTHRPPPTTCSGSKTFA